MFLNVLYASNFHPSLCLLEKQFHLVLQCLHQLQNTPEQHLHHSNPQQILKMTLSICLRFPDLSINLMSLQHALNGLNKLQELVEKLPGSTRIEFHLLTL